MATVRSRGRGLAVVSVHGELDLSTAPQLRLLLCETIALARRDGPPTVVVDLADVPFADISGLDAVAGVVPAVRACGGRLRVARATPQIRRLLDLVPMPALLPLYDEVEQALEVV
ncbi:hypothetical protein TH66_23060 [Carbonactinospora thermoautotrophica]|uniref:Anti-sigma factor antagonist n=2 Tax=Carbonactinospora thermoautotrophica TaxID=1469144 RepID=A0A132MKG3_9ACTN|nr:hypothetical protein TH66_23060 [Carbonactinospora thermoautotrophica]